MIADEPIRKRIEENEYLNRQITALLSTAGPIDREDVRVLLDIYLRAHASAHREQTGVFRLTLLLLQQAIAAERDNLIAAMLDGMVQPVTGDHRGGSRDRAPGGGA